jgi:hypothetical protein
MSEMNEGKLLTFVNERVNMKLVRIARTEIVEEARDG